MTQSILIIEDDKNARLALQKVLASEAEDVRVAATGEEGVEQFCDKPAALVLTDVRLPGIDGLEVQRQVVDRDPSVYVIVMTAYGTIEKAVTAMKAGAYDFIEKPLDMQGIRTLVRAALADHASRMSGVRPAQQTDESFEGIIGVSPKMKQVFERIGQVANSRATVLVTGENGTGKELVAMAIHRLSPRSDRPLICTNLSAVSPTLVESELFGHVEGAFTDAKGSREGLFAQADGGTLFIDEIGEIVPGLQVKLLRVLQTRDFKPVGGTRPVQVDFRLIAATNKDIEEAVATGEFREDLYYRINVIRIALPPLRERPGDIPLLVNHLVRKYAAANDRTVIGVTDEAMTLLERFDWPGNVRQLENCIEMAVVLTRDEVLGEVLLPIAARLPQPPTADGDVVSVPVGTSLHAVEKEMILRTLDYVEGNKTQAAKILGISPRTLYRKLDEYAV